MDPSRLVSIVVDVQESSVYREHVLSEGPALPRAPGARATGHRNAAATAALLALCLLAGCPSKGTWTDAAAAPAAPPADRDHSALALLAVDAVVEPERASVSGLTVLDDETTVPGSAREDRARVAYEELRREIAAHLVDCRDFDHRIDDEMLLEAIAQRVRRLDVASRVNAPYIAVAAVVHDGLASLLDGGAARAPHALTRLRRYIGRETNLPPLVKLAETAMRPSAAGVMPLRVQVESDLESAEPLMEDVAQKFRAATASAPSITTSLDAETAVPPKRLAQLVLSRLSNSNTAQGTSRRLKATTLAVPSRRRTSTAASARADLPTSG